ncbi:MAG: WGR domain-containing protein [Candidatus Nanoarchaeia archaeon]|nr:WGR domain-containing protein [Candidatus Nanoarchaeia archaeon]
MPNYVKLVMVTNNNNNKFYEMQDNGDGTFIATWGRIGAKSDNTRYPIRQWDKKYNEKVNKGYEDVTHLYLIPTKESKTGFKEILDNSVNSLVKLLQSFSRDSVKENYNVTTATQLQLDDAQEIMIKLNDIDYKDKNSINNLLLDLFKIIPRKMNKVNYFLYNETSKDKLMEIYMREQSLLDNFATQIKDEKIEKESDSSLTILEAMNLNISLISDNTTIQLIKNKLGEISHKFVNAYEVTNKKTDDKFKKHWDTSNNKTMDLLWHGSRNENWWSIIQTGLLLRPNAVITGKLFGNGTYYSPTAKKSEGYTSINGSYWARGSSKKAFMALYNVHTGNPYNVHSHFQESGKMDFFKLRAKGDYDSLYAHKATGFLYNDEIVIYKEEQNTIKYLIEIQ